MFPLLPGGKTAAEDRTELTLFTESDGEKDVTDDTRAQTASADRDTLRGRRFMALALLLVAALFSGVVIGVLVATHLSEPEGAPETPTLRELRALLQKNPTNTQIKEAIRKEDLRAREMYFTDRRRIQTGAYLLLVGLVGVVLCGRWYGALDPKTPMPSSLAERTDVDRLRETRRRNAIAIAGVGAILTLGLVVAAL